MAREYASVKVSIWADDDFRTLSVAAQHLYFLLLTSPTLNHAGVADWRPNRIAALAGGWSAEDVAAAGEELEGRLFLVIDWDTEEVLIRSFIRHDGLMKQPKMAVSMANAHASISSAGIRGVVVHELQRLKEDQPELNGWGSARASELLSKGSVNPSSYPLRKGSASGSVKGLSWGSVYPKPTPNPKGSVKGSPTPAPAPAPTTSNLQPAASTSPLVGGPGGEASQQAAPPDHGAESEQDSDRTDKGTRLSEDWHPSQKQIQHLREKYDRPDDWWRSQHEQFMNYWIAKPGKDGRKTSWSRTFTNWVHESIRRESRGHQSSNRRPVSESFHGAVELARRLAQDEDAAAIPPRPDQLQLGESA